MVVVGSSFVGCGLFVGVLAVSWLVVLVVICCLWLLGDCSVFVIVSWRCVVGVRLVVVGVGLGVVGVGFGCSLMCVGGLLLVLVRCCLVR